MSKPDMDRDRIVFLDTETTGLDLEECHILEIAAVMTDLSGKKEFGSVNRVIRPQEGALDHPSFTARDLHEGTGLLDEISLDSSVCIEQAASEIVNMVRENDAGGNIHLSGSGVSEYDRIIIRRIAPELESVFHYRSVDISMIRKILLLMDKDIGYGDRDPFLPPGHRAMADVRQAMAQWEWFRENLEVKQ